MKSQQWGNPPEQNRCTGCAEAGQRGREWFTPPAASAPSLKTAPHLPFLPIWYPKEDLIHFKMRGTYLHYEAIMKILRERQFFFSKWLHMSWKRLREANTYKYIKLNDQWYIVKLFNVKENLVLKIWYLTFCQKYSLYFFIFITSKHVF